jgi:HK97 family phage prohead protease
MPDRSQRQVQRTDKHGRTRTIEYRAVDVTNDGQDGVISGYLSVFWVVDTFATAFAPTAFDKTLRERGDKLPLLYQHNPDWAIGKLANLAVDAKGLRHESTIVDDGAEGTVARKRIAGGVPFGHSHGFQTIRERPATDEDPLIILEGTPEWIVRNLPHSVWVIEEVKEYEGSIVTFPANELATIDAMRSDLRAQALSQTLEDLRAGRLDAAGRALVAEIAAAWQAAPDSLTAAPRTDAEARRDREIALSILARNAGLTLEQLVCAP